MLGLEKLGFSPLLRRYRNQVQQQLYLDIYLKNRYHGFCA